MDDFFDFNNDGHMDLGEQYVGYKILEDCTKESGGTFGNPPPVTRQGRLSGFELIMLALLAFEVLKLICSLLY